MTTKIWKKRYLTKQVIPALLDAGYEIDDGKVVGFMDESDQAAECHMRFIPTGSSYIVTYDARLFDDTTSREYPNGL